MDKLDKIFELQKSLNEGIVKERNLPALSKDEWLQKQILAALAELGELLAETNFKWWKNEKSLNEEHIKEELIDVFHFFVSMCLVMDMDAEECFRIYIDKNRENIARQQGKSDKQGYKPE